MRQQRITREVRVGELFDVELRDAGTAGFSWTLDSDGDGNWCLVERLAAPARGFGAQPLTVYRFKMLHPGHTRISADLKRPWEGEPEERLVIDVDAR